jgi:hypothetical protein
MSARPDLIPSIVWPVEAECAQSGTPVAEWRRRPLLLEEFIPRSALAELTAEVLSAPFRRVTATRQGHDNWNEHSMGDEGLLWRFMNCPAMDRLIESLLQSPVTTRVGWANVYGPDERIGWHRDTDGDLQLLLCLEKSASGGGS